MSIVTTEGTTTYSVASLEVQLALLNERLFEHSKKLELLADKLDDLQEEHGNLRRIAHMGVGGLAVLIALGTVVGWFVTTGLSIVGRHAG